MRGNRNNPGWFRSLAYRSPLYALTLGGKVPAALATVPTDPWPGDAAAGSAILAGRYDFAGAMVSATEPDWSPEAGTAEWRAALHGFEWLRDLRALGGDDARRHARVLVAGWIDRNSGWQAETWSPEILGARIANWIGLHDFFCLSADDAFRARVFDSLARQARHLCRVLPGQAAGAGLILGAKGLIFAGVGLPDGEKPLATGLRLLQKELPRQILPDGGHVERSPARQLEILRHLVDIRAALRAAKAEVPDPLQHAIDRMTPALRFFRHGDNALALFNGSQEGEPALIDSVLAQSDARGRPLKSMPHTGYERLLAGRTLVLVDVGAPPPPGLDRSAHAGLLAFELSIGRERVIVNCGAHPAGGAWRRALAATAAHSTLTVAETNAAEVLESGGLGRRPTAFTCERIENEGATLVEASHDGYQAGFGLTHRRRLYLADDGEDIRGEDALEGPAGHPFAIRFHLHPGVQVSLVQSGAAALLRLPSGIGWRLRATGGTIEIAESIYLGRGHEPRRTSQIIVTGTTEPDRTAVKWALRREKKT